MVTADHILQFAPKALQGWPEALIAAMEKFEITSGVRAEMFLAQCCHESAGLTRFTENLNYSAEGLMRTWPSRFPNLEAAVPYEHNPMKLANHVYANRLGNGNEASGDGAAYIGRGAIQITGRNGYAAAGKAIGYPLDRYPTDMLLPRYGAPASAWYWQSHGLNELADRGEFMAITKRINGALNGQQDRERWLARARAVITGPDERMNA